jgi:hypothetical protein
MDNHRFYGWDGVAAGENVPGLVEETPGYASATINGYRGERS